jgi:hypothetical protein
MLRTLVLISLFLVPASALAQSSEPSAAAEPKPTLTPPADAPDADEEAADAAGRPSALNTSVARGEENHDGTWRVLRTAIVGGMGGLVGGMVGGMLGAPVGALISPQGSGWGATGGALLGYLAVTSLAVSFLGTPGGSPLMAVVGMVLGTAVAGGLYYASVSVLGSGAATPLHPIMFVSFALAAVGPLSSAILYEWSAPAPHNARTASTRARVAPTLAFMPGGGAMGGLVATF